MEGYLLPLYLIPFIISYINTFCFYFFENYINIFPVIPAIANLVYNYKSQNKK